MCIRDRHQPSSRRPCAPARRPERDPWLSSRLIPYPCPSSSTPSSQPLLSKLKTQNSGQLQLVRCEAVQVSVASSSHEVLLRAPARGVLAAEPRGYWRQRIPVLLRNELVVVVLSSES